MASTDRHRRDRLTDLLGDDADSLLNHVCETVDRSTAAPARPRLHRPRRARHRPQHQTLRNLHAMFNHGRLAGTGYVSILPVDQGIEHSAGGELRAQPDLLRPARTSSSSRSRAAATPSPRRSACSARSAASRRTRSRSSSSSTTTSC